MYENGYLLLFLFTILSIYKYYTKSVSSLPRTQGKKTDDAYTVTE